MVTAQESQLADRVMKIFIGLGAKNVTLSSIPDVTFFMDEIIDGYIAKCAVKCDAEKAWVGRDSIYKFYQSMQSYMPYSGMKRGYYIATGAFMKDAKVKVAEINAEREDFEIILVNSSDLDQYEVKEVEVPVEQPKQQKKQKAKPATPTKKEVQAPPKPIESIAPVAIQPAEMEAAEIVEQPAQKKKWLAKKPKQPKEAKQPINIANSPVVKFASEINLSENGVVKFIGGIFSGIGSYVSSITTDLPFEYLLVFIGLACAIIVVVLVMILHHVDAPLRVGNTAIFP
jgi:hypothetical protein